MPDFQTNPIESRAVLLRGAIVQAAYRVYPNCLFRSQVESLFLRELELPVDQLNKDLAYLEDLNLITTETVKIIGRADIKIRLTANGVGVAKRLDPENPILPQDQE